MSTLEAISKVAEDPAFISRIRVAAHVKQFPFGNGIPVAIALVYASRIDPEHPDSSVVTDMDLLGYFDDLIEAQNAVASASEDGEIVAPAGRPEQPVEDWNDIEPSLEMMRNGMVPAYETTSEPTEDPNE